MSDPPTLLTLPTPLLDRIIAGVLAHDHNPDPADPSPTCSPTRTRLAAVSRTMRRAVRRVVARTLTLVDDDSLLLDAQSAPHALSSPLSSPAAAEGPSGGTAAQGAPVSGALPPTSLLGHVAQSLDWAHDVRELHVVAPAVARRVDPEWLPASTTTRPEDDPGAFADDPFTIPPLDDAAFFLLLSRLSNLTTFTWRSDRLPPEALCAALGQACKSLTSFSFDLVPALLSAWGVHDLSRSAGAAPGSPQLGTSPTSSPLSHHGAAPVGTNGHPSSAGVVHLRWEAPHLSALPPTLSHLSLAHLSAAGARTLGASLPSLPVLEELELSKTLFVDDALLGQVGAAAKTLKKLAVRDMGGTKLSEAGLKVLFDGCEGLQVLELDCRFSRTCWQKLAPLPSSLHTLRLVYSEQPPHKSWVVDHLSSLPAILGVDASALHTLSVTRRPQPYALVPGAHHLARYPIEPVMEPRPLSTKAIDAIVEREEQPGCGGREWRTLELDLFALDPDRLKRILDGAPGLRRLQILFDSPFRNLLTLAPSFAACSSLRHCLVSVPPQHTPELASLTPAEYLAAVPPVGDSAGAASPDSPPLAPVTGPTTTKGTSSRAGAGASPAKEAKEDKHHHPLRALDSCLPPTRDWRRFCKKAHSVERVAWIGRGGLGQWTFGAARAGSSLIRVEFEPTRPSPGVVAAFGGGEQGSGPLVESTQVPWTPQQQPHRVPAAVHAQRRRSSTVSLAETCLSNLSLTSDTLSDDDYSTAPSGTSPSLATPPLGASPPMMSFAAAGWSVSPRKGSDSALGPAPPSGVGSGYVGGAGPRRRSSSSAAGLPLHGKPSTQMQPSLGGPTALGLALPSAWSTGSPPVEDPSADKSQFPPTRVSLGWAASTFAPTTASSDALPAAGNELQQEHPPVLGTSPTSSSGVSTRGRSWAAAVAPGPVAAGAGWAEQPPVVVVPETTTPAAGTRSSHGQGKGAPSPPPPPPPQASRRGRGGTVGRKREMTQ